ncbi:hypothetical protein [Psychrobacillus lasiicapitis]|uniref:SbsC C-terminal domain-containing protein n=1 Tax=Psychrobacillus lasiicapitis TaxID=1636719 RepID=A0A544TBR9_9BACI|nr:hypothetical protein [Psychrobacillus lasiicapitis]TQR14903.1 hypothetical protein FG382_05415 [Psychrobacillus lasiicapitis]GGA20929.1 hypothetical protein GCM10011384_07990 [Psychrobacillus lasiicapitis]
MNNKTMKLAISTAIASSVFIAATPSNQTNAAAATNIDKLMTNVQNASTVLKWAISVEGSADGVTQPWTQYNEAKNAIAQAEAEIKKLSFSDQLTYEARLSDPKIQLKRTQGYLDAITASTKINEKTSALSTAVDENNLEKVEKAYHEMTAEFRKQTILLDRVYGQSTRDKIRNAVKGPAEKLIKELKNDVTVHMLTKAAVEDMRVSKQAEATRKINEAQAILDANILMWETTLQKSLDTVTNAVPVQISSISRADNTTVIVKFNRAVSTIKATDFTIDNALSVINAVLSKDGLSATLTTSAQTPSIKYTVKYKGSSSSYTVPGSIVPIQIGDTTTQHRETSEVLALSATFAGSYGNNTVRVDIPAGVKLLTINGIENVISGAKNVNVLPDKNGKVTITFTAKDVNTAALDKTISFNQMVNSTVVDTLTSAKINFYALAKAGTMTNKKIHYVDINNNYFVTSDGLKYKLKGSSDSYRNEGIAISSDSFKSALDIEDTISGTYQLTSASSFNITENHYSVGLSVDSKFARKSGTTGYRMIGKDIELIGTGQPNYEVFFFKNGAYLSKVKMNSTGTWKYKTTVTQNDITDFTMIQQPAGKATPSISDWNGTTLRVVEGPFNLSSITAGNDNEEDISNKVVAFNIAPITRANGTTVAQDQAVISKTSSITVQDSDGTQVQFTNNESGTLFTNTTKGFNIKFGPTVEDKLAGKILKDGEDGTLSGPLDVISVDGVSNAYGFILKVNTGFQIKGY